MPQAAAHLAAPRATKQQQREANIIESKKHEAIVIPSDEEDEGDDAHNDQEESDDHSESENEGDDVGNYYGPVMVAPDDWNLPFDVYGSWSDAFREDSSDSKDVDDPGDDDGASDDDFSVYDDDPNDGNHVEPGERWEWVLRLNDEGTLAYVLEGPRYIRTRQNPRRRCRDAQAAGDSSGSQDEQAASDSASISELDFHYSSAASQSKRRRLF